MIKIKEIEILQKIKETKPLNGTYKDKLQKFKLLLKELCEFHSIEIPKLFVPRDPKKYAWAKKRDGDYNLRKKIIRLKRLSMVTLLHEFQHHLQASKGADFNKDGERLEWDAIYYSNILFYKVWPERIKNLSEIRELARKKNIKQYLEIHKNNDPTICAIIDSCLKH